VQVFRRLRVALFSTGNELRTPGQPLEPGCVYDSNRYSLMGALQRLGADVIDLGLVADDPAALRQTLQRAVAEADVVLTSGGVSMGDADYTRDILAELGQVAFWKVAMRPGRPFAFGPPTAIRKRPGRSEFQRGIVEPAPGGGWQVRLTGSQGAGVLRSMSEANALVVLDHDQASVAEGEFVDVCLFEGLA
jgi:molybdopterin molybdotransferase